MIGSFAQYDAGCTAPVTVPDRWAEAPASVVATVPVRLGIGGGAEVPVSFDVKLASVETMPADPVGGGYELGRDMADQLV